MNNRPAPPLRKFITEVRAPLAMANFLLRAQGIPDLPQGDGHLVMFLPAFTMGDEGLRPMARAVQRLGYATCGWAQGRNLGLREQTLQRLIERLDQLHAQQHEAVSLVGWSAGGLYAREMARARPHAVRRVITLGSPIRPHGSGQAMVGLAQAAFEGLLALRGRSSFTPLLAPPPVACSAIHSKADGVVDWRAAIEIEAPQTENLEVGGTHLSFGYSLEVLRLLADRLARPPWEPSTVSSSVARAGHKRAAKPV
ncbi:esterase/lipase family protein [Panacagrimonas sp.]|uniref:esterase/lipase family protein n=1 Tax=Panacagrimonas sp. TaxID=2480088 RepID=UPI003B527073